MNNKNKETLIDAFDLLKSLSFKTIYIILIFTLTFSFITNSNVFINTDKAGYIDAINLLSSLLVGIVATTYSITIVALQLASTQFSPRVLRYFLSKNKYVQLTLGIFMGWVMYCLLLKFWYIDSLPFSQTEIPQNMIYLLDLAIYGCIFLIAGLLPHFILTIAEYLNVASIIRKISLHTIDEINKAKLFWTHQLECNERPHIAYKRAVLSRNFGYLQSIDYEKLRQISLQAGVELVEQVHDVGSFILKDTPIAYVAVRDDAHFARIEKDILKAVKIYKYRSYHQDINFGVRQLVDIALKAISPAVNDPTTAINVIDYIGEIIKELMQANMPINGNTRWQGHNLYLNESSFFRVVNQAFDQIYHYGRSDFSVTARLLNTIYKITPFAHKMGYVTTLADEIIEVGMDFCYQYSHGNLRQAHSTEQLHRLFSLIIKNINKLTEQSQSLETNQSLMPTELINKLLNLHDLCVKKQVSLATNIYTS